MMVAKGRKAERKIGSIQDTTALNKTKTNSSSDFFSNYFFFDS